MVFLLDIFIFYTIFHGIVLGVLHLVSFVAKLRRGSRYGTMPTLSGQPHHNSLAQSLNISVTFMLCRNTKVFHLMLNDLSCGTLLYL